MTIGEVAAICRTHEETVRRWVRSGKLRSVKPGRRVLIRESDLTQFIESTAQKVTQKIEEAIAPDLTEKVQQGKKAPGKTAKKK